MKTTLTLFMMLSFILSCEKHEIETRLSYPFEPNQEIILDVDVIPTEGVIVDYQEMLEEVNADYYNRYGIGVNLILKDPIKYEYPLPYTEPNKITVYIVPSDYIKEAGTRAYTIWWQNNTETHATIILGEEFQKSRTLAHEIGHTFGLQHNKIKNNVMNLSAPSWQYSVPNDFTDEQIVTIKNNLVWYE